MALAAVAQSGPFCCCPGWDNSWDEFRRAFRASTKIKNFEMVLRSFPRRNDRLGFEGTWREAAVRSALIPVYSDWEHCVALTDDGDVVYSEGSWAEARSLTNARWRHIVLAQAAARYPELNDVRPVRQSDDPTCPSCGGTGVVRMGDKRYEDMLCECGGLGWSPKGSELKPI